MTTILDEALALIPNYIDIEAETKRTQQLLNAVGRANDELGVETFGAYSHLIRTGDDLDAIFDALESHNAVRARQAAAETIRNDLFAHRTYVRTVGRKSNPDEVAPALTFLNTRLQHLLSRVKEIDGTLSAITSASAALRGSDAEAQAWQDLERAVAEYTEIRTAQHQITLRIVEDDADRRKALTTHGYIRNAFEDESYWTTVARHVSGWRNVSNDGFAPVLVEWAKNPPALRWKRDVNSILPDSDSAGYLRWLATESTPWVPTIDELDTAYEQAHAMSSSFADIPKVRAALDAYDSYYADITPRRPLDTTSLRAKLPERRRPGRRRADDPAEGLDPRLRAAGIR